MTGQRMKVIDRALANFQLGSLSRRWEPLGRLLEVPRWLGWLLVGGCDGPPPPSLKRLIVLSYIRRLGIKSFVETGTYLGDTLAVVARDASIACWSIELDSELHRAAVVRFQGYSNVQVLHGDSGRLLANVEPVGPVLYWLDGHYSGSGTAQGVKDSPIVEELVTILERAIPTTVILIDDARCFNGADGYPHLDDLLRMLRETGKFVVTVSADIVRCVAKDVYR